MSLNGDDALQLLEQLLSQHGEEGYRALLHDALSTLPQETAPFTVKHETQNDQHETTTTTMDTSHASSTSTRSMKKQPPVTPLVLKLGGNDPVHPGVAHAKSEYFTSEMTPPPFAQEQSRSTRPTWDNAGPSVATHTGNVAMYEEEEEEEDDDEKEEEEVEEEEREHVDNNHTSTHSTPVPQYMIDIDAGNLQSVHDELLRVSQLLHRKNRELDERETLLNSQAAEIQSFQKRVAVEFDQELTKARMCDEAGQRVTSLQRELKDRNAELKQIRTRFLRMKDRIQGMEKKEKEREAEAKRRKNQISMLKMAAQQSRAQIASLTSELERVRGENDLLLAEKNKLEKKERKARVQHALDVTGHNPDGTPRIVSMYTIDALVDLSSSLLPNGDTTRTLLFNTLPKILPLISAPNLPSYLGPVSTAGHTAVVTGSSVLPRPNTITESSKDLFRLQYLRYIHTQCVLYPHDCHPRAVTLRRVVNCLFPSFDHKGQDSGVGGSGTTTTSTTITTAASPAGGHKATDVHLHRHALLDSDLAEVRILASLLGLYCGISTASRGGGETSLIATHSSAMSHALALLRREVVDSRGRAWFAHHHAMMVLAPLLSCGRKGVLLELSALMLTLSAEGDSSDDILDQCCNEQFFAHINAALQSPALTVSEHTGSHLAVFLQRLSTRSKQQMVRLFHTGQPSTIEILQRMYRGGRHGDFFARNLRSIFTHLDVTVPLKPR